MIPEPRRCHIVVMLSILCLTSSEGALFPQSSRDFSWIWFPSSIRASFLSFRDIAHQLPGIGQGEFNVIPGRPANSRWREIPWDVLRRVKGINATMRDLSCEKWWFRRKLMVGFLFVFFRFFSFFFVFFRF